MAHTEFYVTKGSAVSNNNGGGPNLGTNDGPVYTTADCSSSADGTQITDNAAAWAGVQVGDWICFDPAGTANRARVTVAGDPITVTPAVALSALNKTCNVGGAWQTVDYAASIVTTAFVNANGNPPRVNIKYNATAYSEQVTIDNPGSAAIPITYEGYEIVAGDKCPNQNLPKITASAGTTFTCAQIRIRLRCLWVDHASANGAFHAMNITGANDFVEACKATNSSTHAAAHGIRFDSSPGFVRNCLATTSGGSGFLVGAGSNQDFIGCIARDCAVDGFQSNSLGAWYINCIADNCGGDGFELNSNAGCIGCIAYSSGAAGIQVDSTTHNVTIRNCIFSENTTYGIGCAAAIGIDEDYNAFYINGTAETNNVVFRGNNDVVLSISPFIDVVGGNFMLNNVVGGGLLCRGFGSPGRLLDGINIGYVDIGALQSKPKLRGGFRMGLWN